MYYVYLCIILSIIAYALYSLIIDANIFHNEIATSNGAMSSNNDGTMSSNNDRSSDGATSSNNIKLLNRTGPNIHINEILEDKYESNIEYENYFTSFNLRDTISINKMIF